MSQDNVKGWSGNHDDSLGGLGHGHHQMAEGVVAFEAMPTRDAAMSEEIDVILDRLRNGVPRLHRELDELLTRVNRSGSL